MTAADPPTAEFSARPSTYRAWSTLLKVRLNLLVVVTTLAGFYLASDGFSAGTIDVVRCGWLLLGTTACASGAGAFNQLWERELDARMPRTRRRPVPSGAISPTVAAVAATVLCVGGVAVLAALVNLATATLGLATILLYVLVYTPMKTRTTWCTLVGAVPGAIPPVMGATGVLGWAGVVSPVSVSLFAILVAWQMPHFWGLAVMFRKDYAAGGMKMLPVVDDAKLTRTGRSIMLWCSVLLGVSLLPWALGVTDGIYPAVAAALSGLMWAAGLNAALTPGRWEARGLFLVSIAYLPLLLLVLVATRA